MGASRPVQNTLLLLHSRPLSPRCLNLAPLHPQPPNSARLLSSTPNRHAAKPKPRLMPKMRAMQGTRSQLKSLGAKGMPNDIGLMHMTYIKPSWREMPSIFRKPKTRLKLEWMWVKTKFRDFASLITWCKWLSKPRAPLRLKDRRLAALELQKALYTALAEGDTSTLHRICCDGLLNSSLAQITSQSRQNPSASSLHRAWSLTKYLGVPVPRFLPWPLPQLIPFSSVRVVSDRASPLPGLKDTGVRQVVVRINSRQALGSGTEEKTKDVKEYFVIQKSTVEGKEGEWMVWGTTEETSVKEAEAWAGVSMTGGLGLTERLSAMMGR